MHTPAPFGAPRRRSRPLAALAATAAVLLLTLGLSAAPASAATFNVAFGQTIEGAISFPGEQNTYRFNATSGDRLSIQTFCCSGNLRMRLVDPVGGVVWNDAVYTNSFLDLSRTGQYQLTLSYGAQASTGTYKFALNNVRTPQTRTVTYGTTIENGVPQAGMGNIELPGAADRYLFTAKKGDRLSIQTFCCAGNLRMRLIDPVGNVVWNDAVFTNTVATLSRAGQYQLIMSYGSQPSIGTYKLAINEVRFSQTFTVTPPISISNGVPRAGMGNIELPGWKDLYRFQGTAGHRLSIKTYCCAGNLRMRLRSPSGRILWNDVPFTDSTVTLPEDGRYDLFMSYGTQPSVGTYKFDMNVVK